MERLSIIIPAYNEEKRIGSTLKEYSNFFEEKKKNKILDYEIIVVINNTKDKTEEIVKLAERKNSSIKHLNLIKGGKGYAVIEGFRDALKRGNTFIGFVDADMATKPDAFYELFENIGRNDGIIASRYLRGSIVNPKNTLPRILASRAYNLLIRVLFMMPYRDTQCGAKLFKREAIESIINILEITQFAFDVDLLYKLRKKGFTIIEHPTVWSDKKYSTINFWTAGPLMALSVIRLRILYSPFKNFIRVYDNLFAKLKKIKETVK